MSKRKYPALSVHLTLHGQLEVNWEQEYQGEYSCPSCNQGRLINYRHHPQVACNLTLQCNFCQKKTSLTCPVPAYIFRYRPNLACPNPLCDQIGANGQKGWIYQTGNKTIQYKCHFCRISFNPKSKSPNSWINNQDESQLLSFCFDDDIWDLRHFYNKSHDKTISFQTIQPEWYRLQVKQYLHFLLKSRRYASSSVRTITSSLRQLGRVVKQKDLQQPTDINREIILSFLDACKTNKSGTIHSKLSIVREFLEWLELDTRQLIRHRDFPKLSNNDTDWLDEVTRQKIKQHLHKIPAPIARQYLVQEYLAARPGDVCQINFDCLIEENGKWYVKFYQHKTNRWHKLPAIREIRRVIEEQQLWIQQTFESDYSYLFCHFRNLHQNQYPTFLKIKPLPIPPQLNVCANQMIRIIRMLIEREDIRDANGQKPHFTGRITRSSRLQEVRTKYGMEAAQLYADHQNSATTFQHYAPPTKEQVAQVDLPFQKLLMNPDNKFLPWQSLPESLLQNPKAHELDLEIAPRLVVYGHCALDPKTPCPVNLFPKCYGCSSFRPSTGKLPLYERQYRGEQQRLTEAEKVGAELAREEAKATIEAMDKWLPELRRLANG